ncbi:hypothetical protein [Pseudorhodoplanes sinuspersici]|uniref:Uncharacterized protein n=1 Tax=Pseudorhodoplanes sinuspersici TaxID=1235591 RepID=A0A1W6ZLH7_9HYPH|nr:hypothetical protein [Pseudorhodoplanes sinuspersici]ARP98268.1 hypothetical protein CAK95_03545 [Pseudorhodoplanes sinuspersici]RKE65769.1 hypothetical protein DFP91_5812 [Pseudorhodoplanes sinuspersici]
MDTHRFGRKLKLPSTAAIKHQFLLMQLQDEIKALPPGQAFNQNNSVALIKLRRLIAKSSAHLA